MLLTTKGRYAVMAMVDLAAHQNERPVGLAAIANRQEIPLAYLEQIFAKLKRANVVMSVRGPGGGYKLAREAKELSIAEIVAASDETFKMTRCKSDNHGGCMADKTRCMTHDLWDGLSQHIYDYLSGLTLADVVERRIRDKFPREANANAAMFTQFIESMQPGAA